MPVWQRNYYEHIVRAEGELERIRDYIGENPAKWDADPENPKAPASLGNKSKRGEQGRLESRPYQLLSPDSFVLSIEATQPGD